MLRMKHHRRERKMRNDPGKAALEFDMNCMAPAAEGEAERKEYMAL